MKAYKHDLLAESRYFSCDETALRDYFGDLFKPDAKLEISLQDIFRLCPRTKPRSESYERLQHYLADGCGVELVIYSRKTKDKLGIA